MMNGYENVKDYIYNNIDGKQTHRGALITKNEDGTITYKSSQKASVALIADLDDEGNAIIRNTENGNGQIWRQTGTDITDGKINLKVGQLVTGYSEKSVGDGNWYVLGVENKKLLITTNRNKVQVALSGQDGYVNAIQELNKAVETFKNRNMAESARSINVDDINRVTKYNPDIANFGEGKQINSWKNDVTYTLKDGKVYYQGNKYPTVEMKSNYTSFCSYKGKKWALLNYDEKVTLRHTYYYYYPQTLSTSSSNKSEIKDEKDSIKAYELLFANTSDNTTSYWLASQYIWNDNGFAEFGIRRVVGGMIGGRSCYTSNGSIDSYTFGVRPVVVLKNEVKVSENGVLSLE